MAKYKHTEDTKIVLDDLENRVIQLTEINNLHLGVYGDTEDKMIKDQNQGMSVVLTLIRQIRNTGHIQRGTPIIADEIEPRAATKWNKRPQLGLSELMIEANKH